MSEVEMIVCETCGEAKPPKMLHCKGRRGGARLCRACYFKRPGMREVMNLYAAKHRAKPSSRAYMSVYIKEYKKRPEVSERYKKWFDEYRKTDKRKKYLSEYHKRSHVIKSDRQYNKRRTLLNVQSISDTYVKNCIRSSTKGILMASDMPQELIELKRQSIALKRIIKKKQKNEQHTTTDV